MSGKCWYFSMNKAYHTLMNLNGKFYLFILFAASLVTLRCHRSKEETLVKMNYLRLQPEGYNQ